MHTMLYSVGANRGQRLYFFEGGRGRGGGGGEEREREERGRGVESEKAGRGAQFVHDRSRIHDHRPSHPYYAGTEHVGFSPIRQTLLAPSAKRREALGESHKGELHPSKNRS